VGAPVEIEMEIREPTANEWPEAVQNELVDIINVNPKTDASSIIMKVSCAWDGSEESYIPRWEFLNSDRKPFAGKGARAINLQEFFQYIPVFYLEALRDVADEYSSRSQFWGKLLKTIQIPEELEKRSKRIFDLLNKKLLDADEKIKRLAEHLSRISDVAASDGLGAANLRVLPLNTWDILSKAEVIYQTEESTPWLPLIRHGQGVQSLSVVFLFRAFVELIMQELFRKESTPVLALEEPETHLHPQAARSLLNQIQNLPGQKVITTHSPYFLQYVPFRDIRIVRNDANGTSVRSLDKFFRCRLPANAKLSELEASSSGKIKYDNGTDELVVEGALQQEHYRTLLKIYNDDADQGRLHKIIKDLYSRSSLFVSDEDLLKLETFAKRIRGEIFFAHRWLLVEGQSEFHLIHAIAKALGYGLDEHGVAVIDYKNNGSADTFAALARALGYPWLILVDADTAGVSYLEAIRRHGFSQQEITMRSKQLTHGPLETELVNCGLQLELKTILKSFGVHDADSLDDKALVRSLEKWKTHYAVELGKLCLSDSTVLARMPIQLREIVTQLRGLA
jgi:putative ATP-dependent endonuclease of OLD family